MKQHRAQTATRRTDTELDALVLAEIESLSGRGQASRPQQSADRSTHHPDAAVAARPSTRRAPGRVEPLRRPLSAPPERTGEEFEGLDPEVCAEDWNGPDPDPEAEHGARRESLLGAEEEAFITRAVGFLSQRAQADMILGRIWEQLTELDPDGFFEAPRAAVADAPDDVVRGAEAEVSPTTEPPQGPPT